MRSFLIKTFVTGVFVLTPLFFVLYVLIQCFEFLRKIVEPLTDKLDIDRIAGVVVLNLVSVLVLVSVVFLLGLIAYIPAISARVDKLDQLLADRVPGYTILKSIIGGAIGEDTSVGNFQTVLVRYNETARIGFEVERSDDGGVVVYLPNTPNPQTGTAAAFLAKDVEPLDIAPHKAMEMLNFFGRGINQMLATARSQRGTLPTSDV